MVVLGGVMWYCWVVSCGSVIQCHVIVSRDGVSVRDVVHECSLLFHRYVVEACLTTYYIYVNLSFFMTMFTFAYMTSYYIYVKVIIFM